MDGWTDGRTWACSHLFNTTPLLSILHSLQRGLILTTLFNLATVAFWGQAEWLMVSMGQVRLHSGASLSGSGCMEGNVGFDILGNYSNESNYARVRMERQWMPLTSFFPPDPLL